MIELAINEIPRLFYIVAAVISVSQVGEPSLVGAMFLLIPGIVLLAFLSGHITCRNRNKIQARLAGVTAKLAEKIDDIEVIKSYSTEEKEIVAGGRVLDEFNAVRKEGALVDHINKFISNMIWFIDVIIIVVPPTLLMFNGAIDRSIYLASGFPPVYLDASDCESLRDEARMMYMRLKEEGADVEYHELRDFFHAMLPQPRFRFVRREEYPHIIRFINRVFKAE